MFNANAHACVLCYVTSVWFGSFCVKTQRSAHGTEFLPLVRGSIMANSQMLQLSVAERLERASPKLDELVEELQKPSCQMVSLRDAFFGILEEFHLQAFIKLPNECLGTLPSNRGGAWLSPGNIVEKLLTFVTDGFSLIEVERACSVEREPGKVGDDMEERYLRRDLARVSLRIGL